MISDTLYLPARKMGNQLISPIHTSINIVHATLPQKIAQALHLPMWNVTADTTTLLTCCNNDTSMPISPGQPGAACQESQAHLTSVKLDNDSASPRTISLNTIYDSAQLQIPSNAPLPAYPDYNSSQLGKDIPSCTGLEESEEYESLPPYSCSVCKAGYIEVKQYMDKTGIKSRRRSWRTRYFVLRGTSLSLYQTEGDHKRQKDPILKLSMQNAIALPATDYVRRLNVVRLVIFDGPHFLLRANNASDIISWIEQLQASINISLDLDQRAMPKFHTLPRRRRRTAAQHSRQHNRSRVGRTETEYVLDVVFAVHSDRGPDAAII